MYKILTQIHLNYKFKKITFKNVQIHGLSDCLAKGVKILDGIECSPLLAPMVSGFHNKSAPRIHLRLAKIGSFHCNTQSANHKDELLYFFHFVSYRGLKCSFLVLQIVQHYFTISPKICPGNVQLKFISQHLKHAGCEYICLQFQSWNTNKFHSDVPSFADDEDAMNSSIVVLASQI